MEGDPFKPCPTTPQTCVKCNGPLPLSQAAWSVDKQGLVHYSGCPKDKKEKK